MRLHILFVHLNDKFHLNEIYRTRKVIYTKIALNENKKIFQLHTVIIGHYIVYSEL